MYRVDEMLVNYNESIEECQDSFINPDLFYGIIIENVLRI